MYRAYDAEAAFLALKPLGMPFLFSGGSTGRRYSYAGAGPLAIIDPDRNADPFEALSKALS